MQGANGVPGPTGPVGAIGQTGATGATGPAGMALPHVIIVPATADANTNGQALYTAITNSSGASAAQPYLILLDAGTYTFSSAYLVPAYVSIQGQGSASTMVNASQGIYFGTTGATTASISDLTLSTSASLFLTNTGSAYTLHGVVLNSGAVDIDGFTADTLTIRVYDSVIPYVAINSPLHGVFVGSEVDTFGAATSTLTCAATYNANGTLYSNTCN